MILLAFLLPFSLYLLLLGSLNRRRHPVLVAGTWDFAGILFATSGFLLVGGPAILSSGSEHWRMFWMFGAKGLPGTADGGAPFWAFLAGLYFVVVVGGSAFLFWRQRPLTSIYNADAAVMEQALSRVCDRLGLSPLRSGNLYVFGTGGVALARPPRAEGIQPPHYAPALADGPREEVSTLLIGELVGQAAVLEVDAFAMLRHVTLRWEPARSVLRQEIEGELTRLFASTPVAEHPLGDWLVFAGVVLIGFNLLGTFALVLTNYLYR